MSDVKIEIQNPSSKNVQTLKVFPSFHISVLIFHTAQIILDTRTFELDSFRFGLYRYFGSKNQKIKIKSIGDGRDRSYSLFFTIDIDTLSTLDSTIFECMKNSELWVVNVIDFNYLAEFCRFWCVSMEVKFGLCCCLWSE